MPHTTRRHRHKRAILPRRGRQVQAADGVGHRDMVVQTKRWLLFGEAGISNATNQFAYGLRNINISTTSAGIANAVYNRLISGASLTYEEYRLKRVVIRAQCGTGFTNDDRIKASIFARVDCNSQPGSATLDNLNTLICSESCVNRTFTERGNVMLVDFRPICYSSGGSGASSRPLLPNSMQWYNIDEAPSHIWRGATVAPLIPESSISPGTKAIVTWAEVEVEFRSRRPDFSALTALFAEDEGFVEEAAEVYSGEGDALERPPSRN